MITLIIETSTERGIIAAFKKEVLLFEEHLSFGLQSSHFLLPMLQNKIDGGLFKQEELTSIIVGIGPGSYTGIRVGATIAKCLAFSLNIPAVGIGTLETFVPEEEGSYAVLIDAKIGGVYMQKGTMQGGQAQMISQPQVYPLEEAANLLLDIPLIVTPNAAKIESKLKPLVPHLRWQESYPSALQMFQVGSRQDNQKTSDPDHVRLELLYLRKTQAEIERYGQ